MLDGSPYFSCGETAVLQLIHSVDQGYESRQLGNHIRYRGDRESRESFAVDQMKRMNRFA